MTYYGEGPMTLVAKNKTRCDYASILFCVKQKKKKKKRKEKRDNTCVFIVKERNRQIIYISVT